MKKIKLVVVDEHTLGYIFPEQPNTYHILKESILKGSPYNYNNGTSRLIYNQKIRLASENDFNEFNVIFDGYKNNPNEYEFLN